MTAEESLGSPNMVADETAHPPGPSVHGHEELIFVVVVVRVTVTAFCLSLSCCSC